MLMRTTIYAILLSIAMAGCAVSPPPPPPPPLPPPLPLEPPSEPFPPLLCCGGPYEEVIYPPPTATDLPNLPYWTEEEETNPSHPGKTRMPRVQRTREAGVSGVGLHPPTPAADIDRVGDEPRVGGTCGRRDLDCNEAVWGRGAFRDPPQMWVGKLEMLEFAVARTDRGLARELDPHARPSRVNDVYIGRCMRVTLIAPPSLQIQSRNGVVTRLARDLDRASWSWSVMPLDPGNPTVRAKVEVLRQNGGRCSQEAIDEYTERVGVRVNIGLWRGFLRSLGEAKTIGELFGAVFTSWERAFVGLGLLLAAIGGAIASFKALVGRSPKRRVKPAR